MKVYYAKKVIVPQSLKANNEGSYNDNKIKLQNSINKNKVIIDTDIFKKSIVEKEKLKTEKFNFKHNKSQLETNKILRAFIDSNIPNWNFKFIINKVHFED
jgi:hypothetical protein